MPTTCTIYWWRMRASRYSMLELGILAYLIRAASSAATYVAATDSLAWK
jgi:hypothetical protein